MKSKHPHRVPEYLQHILDAMAGMDFSAFENDTRTQDAVIRSIEVVGEAELRVEPNWPHDWLMAAQVHLLFAYAHGYSAGVMNSLQALDDKERSTACKLAK